jgi:hypothetical protein
MTEKGGVYDSQDFLVRNLEIREGLKLYSGSRLIKVARIIIKQTIPECTLFVTVCDKTSSSAGRAVISGMCQGERCRNLLKTESSTSKTCGIIVDVGGGDVNTL